MGRTLYGQSAAARSLYDEANRLLGWDLAKISFEGPEVDLTKTRNCQLALFVHGLAVLAALREAGKLPAGEPKFGLGLSLGEVTAYCAAGVFDFATGLRVVAERGRLMQQACEQTSGGMAAIMGEDRAKVHDLCREFQIETANFNAPGQIIVSGEKARVRGRHRGGEGSRHQKDHSAQCRRRLPFAADGAGACRLRGVSRLDSIRGLQISRCSLNTTGQAVSEPAADQARRWCKQVVSSVLWEDCMRSLRAAAGATGILWNLRSRRRARRTSRGAPRRRGS